MFIKKTYVVFLFLIGFSFCVVCPPGCFPRENTSYCDCPSNLVSGNTSVDLVLENVSVGNSSINFSYFSYGYSGDVKVCLYVNDELISTKIVNVENNVLKNSSFDFGICGSSKLEIILNCDYTIDEKNYSNNVKQEFTNIDCVVHSSAGYTVPENPLYVLILFIIILVKIFLNNKKEYNYI